MTHWSSVPGIAWHQAGNNGCMTRMLAARRHGEIIRRIQSAGTVSVAELALAFAVSHETIRRDLKQLAELDHVDVIHGGATRRGARPASARRVQGTASHTLIGKAAAALVPEAGSVLLGPGIINAAIACELAKRTGLTIHTNALGHAAALCGAGNTIRVLGGEVDAESAATAGDYTAEAISRLRVDVAFVDVGGFAEDGWAAEYSRLTADLHGRMAMTGVTYFVADHGKFCRRAPFRIAHFDHLKGIIVDRAPDHCLAAAWSARAITVILADEQSL